MDASNQAMWREAGLKGGASMDRTYIVHPYFEGAYLFFSPDTPHLLKAMKTAMCNHDFILTDEVVQKNNLPADTVSTFTDGCYSDQWANTKKQIVDLMNCHDSDMLRYSYMFNKMSYS